MRIRWGILAKSWATAVLMTGLGLASSASASLISRGPDLVYDNVLNITWTRNASLPGSSVLTWAQANAWAANLVFAGFDDWRLATVNATSPLTSFAAVTDCGLVSAAVCAASGNELGYMYYQDLAGQQGNNMSGTQTAVGGEVLTGIPSFPWSGTDFGGDFHWGFNFKTGLDFAFTDSGRLSAWAVRSGDVTTTVPVPLPPTFVLVLAGLGLLGWRTKRR